MELYYTINPSYMLESKKIIEDIKENDYVFLSCHVLEENNKDYVNNIKELISLTNKHKGRIIADVSKRSLKMFNAKDFIAFKNEYKIYALRIDFGLTLDEIIHLAKAMPIVINASTIKIDEFTKIKKVNKKIIAMFNYYPRPETGNDIEQFIKKSLFFKENSIKVFSFISGNNIRRGPIYKGLTTLEHQRDYSPYVSFIEIDKLNLIDAVFVGDITIKNVDKELIAYYQKNKVIPLLAKLNDKSLFDKVFTSRIDSPNNLIRIKESREYASKGKDIKPYNNIKRKKGSITIDNVKYLRYSGEMMIVKTDFPKDDKVNVIGAIKEESMPLLEYINPDDRFIFIK